MKCITLDESSDKFDTRKYSDLIDSLIDWDFVYQKIAKDVDDSANYNKNSSINNNNEK